MSDTVAEILYQYFVDEFHLTGEKWLPNKALIESMKTDIHAIKAETALNQHYYHKMVEIIGEDEKGTTWAHSAWFKGRKDLRAELRAAAKAELLS